MQTPYFVFKPEIVEENYNELKTLCDKYLKKYIIAYSVKTNSYKGLIDKLNGFGSHFEVASLDEINLVKNTKKINIFNGPGKIEEELRLAIAINFLINVDSISELYKIIKILKGKNLEIGIRISLKESKFGFDETQLKEVFEMCNNNNLKIVSFHFHLGTQLSIKEYENNLIRISKFIENFQKKELNNFELKYLNLGGGFPDKLKLKNNGLKVEDFLKLITEYLNKIKKKYNFTVILEPGRFLVADSFHLITKVLVIKNNFDDSYAILDVGINVLPKITLSQFKFSKINQFKEFETKLDKLEGKEKLLINENHYNMKKKQEYILAGPLLFNNDIIGRFQGNLKEGDLIKIENVGAYCYALAWEISYKKPEIIVER